MTPKLLTRRRILTGAAQSLVATAMLNPRLLRALAATPSALAADLQNDPRRPQFHLLPAANWMNDPNGPIYWNGKYHMFFQYNPHAAVWGDMHWYHSVSPDMIHWQHMPIAIAPTPGGPDADGCFSGTAIVKDKTVHFIYTGVQKVPADRADAEATLRDGHNDFRETQLLATSTDPDLKTWTKRSAPVIPLPPSGLKVTGFRDPAPWREPALYKEGWLLAVGSGESKKGGLVLLYKSTDLETWEYLHPLHSGAAQSSSATNPVDSGEMWECPDVFPLGPHASPQKHILIYSTQGKVFWQSGTIDPQTLVFAPLHTGLLDYGSFYAPKTQLDQHGNRILWGWIPETRPEAEFSASGWAGLMSLPRVLTLGPDDRLRITPAPAVNKLRQQEQKLKLVPASAATPTASKTLLASATLKQACGELLCLVKPGSEPFTLDLVNAQKPAEASYLSIRYSHANPGEIVVDQQRMPIQLAAREPLQLHFYIDGSVIELFVSNQATFTKRFYYPGSIAPEIQASITGNKADITHLSQWQLTPITQNRLTTA